MLFDLGYARLEQLSHELKRRLIVIEDNQDASLELRKEYGTLEACLEELKGLTARNDVLRRDEAAWLDDVVGRRRDLPDFTSGCPGRRMVLIWQAWLRRLGGVVSFIDPSASVDVCAPSFEERVPDAQFDMTGEEDLDTKLPGVRETLAKVVSDLGAMRQGEVGQEPGPGLASLSLTGTCNKFLRDVGVLQDRLDRLGSDVSSLIGRALEGVDELSALLRRRVAIYAPYRALRDSQRVLAGAQRTNQQVLVSLLGLCCMFFEELSGVEARAGAFDAISAGLALEYAGFLEERAQKFEADRARRIMTHRDRHHVTRQSVAHMMTHVADRMFETQSGMSTGRSERGGGHESPEESPRAGTLAVAISDGVIRRRVKPLGAKKRFHMIGMVAELYRCAAIGGLAETKFHHVFRHMRCHFLHGIVEELRPMFDVFGAQFIAALRGGLEVCRPLLECPKVDRDTRTMEISVVDVEVETDDDRGRSPARTTSARRAA